MATGDVLVIGKGAREHALIWKLKQSPSVRTIYAAPGNPGTARIAKNIPIEATDLPYLLAFACEKDIDLTVVGPEIPLKLGIVDLFRLNGLNIFGPTLSAARIETSKAFAKDIMSQSGIPTAPFKICRSYQEAHAVIHERDLPFVVKADGLAGGKGVSVCREITEAEHAIKEMMIERIYGAAGDIVVIEDCLIGQEVSIHALCNEKLLHILPPARDSKAIKDGDKGPNTGGMGVFSPISAFTSQNMFHMEQTIIKRCLNALKDRGAPFTGLLYPGLMITSDGPKVLEFNSRFGDPETQSLMTLTNGDLFLALKNCCCADSEQVSLSYNGKHAVCIVLCSREYPYAINNPVPIYGIERAKKSSDRITIFHGATQRIGDQLYTNGGRVLSIVATADTLQEARILAYQACGHIEFEGKQYRTDIAKEVA